jgi:Glu-tRNA(Gln) amidotransferase subunit E-like FAD-binding protein
MTESNVDYSAVGLKSGLEIHQQLNTSKLFCNCPSILRSGNPDFEVARKLHLVAGESGEVDAAVRHEANLDKTFIYQGYDTTCLVELDEEPPRLINEEALDIALQISIFLNCHILPVTQIMRKTVIDGSNTSGFQRTVLIAEDGYVETGLGRVGIQSVCLEEDSARIVDRKKGMFKLDRLGIPLVEIATNPDIKNPGQAQEVALHIGEVLRSCNVKRGIGTIRQDVNLSIKGGKRIELKGFQDIRNIGNAMELEVLRQIDLVKRKKSVSEVRNVLANGKSEFLRPMPGAARMYPETDLPLLKISRKMIDNAKKNLPKLKKDIKEELEAEGLSKEMIMLILKEDKLEEYKELLQITNRPDLTAKVIVLYPKEIASKENASLKKVYEKLNKDVLASVLEGVEKGDVLDSHVKHVLNKIFEGEIFKSAISQETKQVKEIEEEILKLIKSKPGLSPNAYMGLVMKEFKGKVNPREVMETIKKHLS